MDLADQYPYKVQCLCTSTSKVKSYLRDASARLTEALPDLGGIILITASESPAHCYSRRGDTIGALGEKVRLEIECPRCAERDAADVVTELIRLIRDGVRSVSDSIEIVTWNWSWTFYEPAPCVKIISGLPQDVVLLTGFERGGRKTILGHENALVDEYSLSYPGPSQQAIASLDLAKKHNLGAIVKLQIGTTHELATVPNLPLVGNLYDKAKYIKENKIEGFMGCWNFGNMLSVNTSAFNYFLGLDKFENKNSELTEFSADYFPGCDPEKIVEAWTLFSAAMDQYYPMTIPFLYASPINYALAFPLLPGPVDQTPCGRSWLIEKTRGGNLEGSLGDYTVDEIIDGFDQLHKKWHEGMKVFEDSRLDSDEPHWEEELSTIRTCCHVFRSTRNIYEVYGLRKNWSDKYQSAYIRIVEDELDNLKAVLPALEKDSRIGFHIEANGYMFSPELVKTKIKNLEEQLGL